MRTANPVRGEHGHFGCMTSNSHTRNGKYCAECNKVMKKYCKPCDKWVFEKDWKLHKDPGVSHPIKPEKTTMLATTQTLTSNIEHSKSTLATEFEIELDKIVKKKVQSFIDWPHYISSNAAIFSNPSKATVEDLHTFLRETPLVIRKMTQQEWNQRTRDTFDTYDLIPSTQTVINNVLLRLMSQKTQERYRRLIIDAVLFHSKIFPHTHVNISPELYDYKSSSVDYALSSPQNIERVIAVIEAKQPSEIAVESLVQTVLYLLRVSKDYASDDTVLGCITDGLLYYFIELRNNVVLVHLEPLQVLTHSGARQVINRFRNFLHEVDQRQQQQLQPRQITQVEDLSVKLTSLRLSENKKAEYISSSESDQASSDEENIPPQRLQRLKKNLKLIK